MLRALAEYKRWERRQQQGDGDGAGSDAHAQEEQEGVRTDEGATRTGHAAAGSGERQHTSHRAGEERQGQHTAVAQHALRHMSQGGRYGAQEQERKARMRASGAERATERNRTDAADERAVYADAAREEVYRGGSGEARGGEADRSEEGREGQQQRSDNTPEEIGGVVTGSDAGTGGSGCSATGIPLEVAQEPPRDHNTPEVRGMTGHQMMPHGSMHGGRASGQREEECGDVAVTGGGAKVRPMAPTTTAGDSEAQHSGSSDSEDSIPGSLAQTRPKRTTKCVERLGVVVDVPRTRPGPTRHRRAKPAEEIRYMERQGAHGGELRHLVRVGRVTIRRTEQKDRARDI